MDSEKLAELAADACDDRKAVDIQLIRVDEVSSLADWMVIAGGQSDVQVRAIARSVEDRLEDEVQRLPLRKEGVNEVDGPCSITANLSCMCSNPGNGVTTTLKHFGVTGNVVPT